MQIKKTPQLLFSRAPGTVLHLRYHLPEIRLIRGYGGIGRRAGFRFQWSDPCGFDPHYPYQLRLLKKMQPLKPLLRQGFKPFQRTKSSTRRDGDASKRKIAEDIER